MQNDLLIIPENGAQGHSRGARQARAKEVAAWLKTTFPALFATHPPLPLAIGVHSLILQINPNINRAALGAAMHWHTSKPAYLRSLAAPDSMRYDLDGNPVEPVTAEQRDFAKARLAEWQKATEAARRASGKARKASKDAKRQGDALKPPEAPPPAKVEPAPETPRLRPLLNLKPKGQSS